MKKIDLSKEKIRYVALGDSISEGYNGKYNFGYAGSMDLDNTISGTSWPSFLARNLQKIDKNILESFDNFSMSGTRPEDWNYFLNVQDEKYSYQNSIDKINYAIWLNELKNNPERRRLKKQFKNFGKKSRNDFEYLISKIVLANLITINIGANFIIPRIPIDRIIEITINYPDPLLELKTIIKNSVHEIEKDIIIMLNRIKDLNPLASIYLVGYNKMFGTFWKILDLFLKELGMGNNIVEYCYDEINNSLKRCAKKAEVYFISTNNKKFWDENSYMMCNVFYEAHPTIFGYKKIAQDVLLKISASDSFFEKDNLKNITKQIKSFNDSYLKQDYQCFQNGIDFEQKNISNQDLIEKIYGLNDELLFKKTKIENSSKFLETSLFFEQALDDKNDPNNFLSRSLKRTFLIIVNSLELNFDKKAISDFNELIEMKYFKKFIMKINLISVVANKIQNQIDQKFLETEKNLTIDEFFNILFDQILNFDFITWVLVEFANFWTLEEENKLKQNRKNVILIFNRLLAKNRVKIIIETITQKLISYLLISKLGIELNDKYLDQISAHLNSQIDYSELGQIIFNFYFLLIEEIKRIKKSEELLELFLQNEKINNFVYSILKKIILGIKIDDELVLYLMKLLNIENSKSNFKIMKHFFVNIFSCICNEKYSFIEIISDAIINFAKQDKNSITFQDIIEFLLESDKKKFWSQIENIKIEKISSETFLDYVKALDLIFVNMDYDGIIFKNILNLTNPKGLVENNKMKIMKLLKFLDKLSKTKRFMSNLCNKLITSYYASNSKDKTKNLYYKTFFRLMLISLFVLRQLFQKNIDKNYFMDKRISIVRILFQIAGYKHGKNASTDNLMLDMFNETGNYDLIMDNNDSKQNVLKPLNIIYSLDKNSNKENNDKSKLILEILKKGYI